MSVLTDLIKQVDDPALRERLMQETDRLVKQKKFGLVFEEHLPECTPLYDVPIHVGSKVALKTGYVSDIYTVLSIDGDKVICDRRETHEQKSFNISEIVSIAEFGEPIYPTLKMLDYIENAPDSDLWHTLIEADNYHALQLLEYLYPEKVDCIYIDPPYNTGARDWKYNNDYVDSSDQYRHSKWLSMMEKRLRLAKKLLNPKDSVLIITIDEKEYLHLGCLLEELFPEAKMQMVCIVIQAAGQNRKNELGRVDEYAFFLFFGSAIPFQSTDDLLNENPSTKVDKVRWESLLRGGTGSTRADSPNLFYPVFIDKKSGRIVGCGETKPVDAELSEWTIPDNVYPVWPYKTGMVQGRWRATRETLMNLVNQGWAKAGPVTGEGKGTIWYVGKAARKKVETGEFVVRGLDEQGAKIIDVVAPENKTFPVKTVWNRPRHHAGWYGTNLLSGILPNRKFSFPKSLYAVEDTLRIAVGDKKDALILDFFAGSGTTLHAVNLLNSSDDGNRRCILVTNNEVSEKESAELIRDGYKPGDDAWEKFGIARYVTWPRTTCSIKGVDINGNSLKGKYIDSEIPMADGFKTNAAYFKLAFLDKTAIALGRQFRELLPVLWMKSGAFGRSPVLSNDNLPEMLILPQNKMAILIDEKCYADFDRSISDTPEIKTVFIITDSDSAFRSMTREYNDKVCYQLYRDYLDNFRINIGR